MTSEEQDGTFRRWMTDHAGLMFKVVRAWAAAPEDQEDLFQEILLQLWSSMPSYRGEAKETTWIYRVAFNTALVWRRGEQRRRKKHENFLQFEAVSPLAASAAETLCERETVERLYAAIRQLSKADITLALMHLDGMSYREMSDVLGISEGNVGVRLNRIRKQLAEKLNGVPDEL